MVVLGGRSPDYRWGAGALQELDQPPHPRPGHQGLLDHARRRRDPARRGPRVRARRVRARRTGVLRHPDGRDLRPGPARATSRSRWWIEEPTPIRTTSPRARDLLAAGRAARCSSSAATCGWAARRGRALRLVASRNLPVIANGMGRGVVPPADPLLVTRARGAAFGGRRPRRRGRHAARLPARLRRLRRPARRTSSTSSTAESQRSQRRRR